MMKTKTRVRAGTAAYVAAMAVATALTVAITGTDASAAGAATGIPLDEKAVEGLKAREHAKAQEAEAAARRANAIGVPIDDPALAPFLEAVKYCDIAGVGTATSVERKKVGRPEWPWTVGIEGNRVLYGKAGDVSEIRVFEQLDFENGEDIIWCSTTWPVNETTTNTSSCAVKWTAERENAVNFALAPGWKHGSCPWHRYTPRTKDVVRCDCGRGGHSGSDRFCATCATTRGECTLKGCTRTIGPATRGVELKLWYMDPRNKTKISVPKLLDPGAMPSLYLTVKNDKPQREVPEIVLSDKRLATCKTLFFIVEGPGCEGGENLGFQRPRIRMIMSRPAPLTGSAEGPLTLLEPNHGGRLVFSKPGEYTVRAVAGRLISNPLTFRVPREMDEAAGPREATTPQEAFETGRRSAVRTINKSNLRQVGVALVMYAKNKGNFPDDPEQLVGVYIDKKGADLLLWKNPATGEKAKYIYCKGLTAGSSNVVMAAPVAVDGEREALYCDGRVRLISGEEFLKIAATQDWEIP